MNPTSVLGIDPGTRHMGLALVRDGGLVAYAVHTLLNGKRPHDVIGQARSKVLAHIEAYGPQVVAMEEPSFRPGRRMIALLNVIVDELRQLSEEFGIQVVEISLQEVRRRLVANPDATKLDVAAALVERFPELRDKLPEKQKRSALGIRPKDKYWLHMFDALGVVVACAKFDRRRRLPMPADSPPLGSI